MKDSRITGKERLDHILRAISEIETFTRGCSKDLFINDRVLVNATLFQFAIIGEAIIHIDNVLLAKYAYPWHKVRGFRNFILHEYHAIDFSIVWETIKNELPELTIMLELIRTKEF